MRLRFLNEDQLSSGLSESRTFPEMLDEYGNEKNIVQPQSVSPWFELTDRIVCQQDDKVADDRLKRRR